MSDVITPIFTAVLGFLGGLITPWVRWRVEAWRNRDTSRRQLLEQWRAAIEAADFHDKRKLDVFGDSAPYSSLRAHMDTVVVERFEARRTVYVVGGGRGDDVRKHMLLDEVARLEKKWGLV